MDRASGTGDLESPEEMRMEVLRRPMITVSDRIDARLRMAERHSCDGDSGYDIFSGDWASLARTLRAAKRALTVPDVWSQVERDGMASAFAEAAGKHDHYETLFAVAAWLLRHRANND